MVCGGYVSSEMDRIAMSEWVSELSEMLAPKDEGVGLCESLPGTGL